MSGTRAGRHDAAGFGDVMERGTYRLGRRLAWVALVLGLGHAAFSLYWALGGTWLLETVGQWAVDAQRQTPGLVTVVLLGVTLVKVAAAIIPVAVEYDKLGTRRFWRAVSWIGGIGVAVYGAANSLVALAVLVGVVHPDDGYDAQAMVGHAFIWDPWFFIWGVTLVISLTFTRSPSEA